jgi:hypothetical protein
VAARGAAMSDTRPEPPPKKNRPQPDWLEEARERLAEWVDSLVNPPVRVPVPVPVRRHR